MQADIEDLVLSGRLFQPDGASSPPRAASPTGHRNDDWPSDPENGNDAYDSDKERSAAIDAQLAAYNTAGGGGGGVGVGTTGRTGVKGVIRDRAEANARARDKRARDIRELNARMEKTSLGGKTWLEEEREKAALEAGFGAGALDRRMGGARRRFGHLREVGKAGFLPAIEKEERDVWVVVHIYDPGLNRCDLLDDTLVQLARQHPLTKFLRTRAKAIGFASSAAPARVAPSSNSITSSRSSRTLVARASIKEEEEDDPYAYHDDVDYAEEDEHEDEDDEDDRVVDTDMLPTLLVYRAGDLVFNWVRVDWEAGADGVEVLLLKNRIISGPASSNGNLGFLSDDEDGAELDFN